MIVMYFQERIIRELTNVVESFFLSGQKKYQASVYVRLGVLIKHK